MLAFKVIVFLMGFVCQLVHLLQLICHSGSGSVVERSSRHPRLAGLIHTGKTLNRLAAPNIVYACVNASTDKSTISGPFTTSHEISVNLLEILYLVEYVLFLHSKSFFSLCLMLQT